MSALRKLLLLLVMPVLLTYGCKHQQTPSIKQSGTTNVAKAIPPVSKGPGKAARIKHADQTFDTYTLNYPKEKIQFFWKDSRGNKLRSIDSLKAYVESKGQQLTFATNAGMYMEDFSPLGLYIEQGKVLRPLNTVKNAEGNFYLQPNGIFLLTATKAMVIPTNQYKNVKEKILFATQSGPMLLINGQLHPAFTRGSKNLNIRSGVGIDSTGKVVIAISNTPANYFDFATLFLNVLHCNNALFLDGAICRMYLPALQRQQLGGDFGAMIGTTSQ